MTPIRRPIWEDDRGQVLLLTALSLFALLGIAALSLDASFMYDKRNRLFAAADAAAKSGAIEVRRQPGISNGNLQTFTDQQVAWHGFQPGGTTTVTVHHPPVSGSFIGEAGYVEVIVSEPTPTFLGVLLGIANMVPTARAVAGTSPSTYCLITFEDIDIGTAHIEMPTCAIGDGGDMSVHNGNAGVNASAVDIGGTCSGTNCPANRVEHVTPGPSDPLSYLQAPADPGGCVPLATPGPNSTLNVTAGCYTSIHFHNNSTIRFGPGIYYIKGLWDVDNSVTMCLNATCTFDYDHGVMFYLVDDGEIDFANDANLRLNAMNSGYYNGILFYQDRANTNPVNFANGSSFFDLSGVMYFPSADVNFANAGGSSNCSLFVANSLTIGNGEASFTNTCNHYGGSPIVTISLAE